MKRPVICILSDYGPEYSGTFIDALLSLSRYCRDRLQIDTFCIFPERARGRRWLQRFDEDKVLYAFVPESRAVVSDVRALLQSYHPVIFHSQFERYDLSAVFLKVFFFKSAKLIWHFHSTGRLTLRQRIKDILKVKVLAKSFGDRFISVGKEVFQFSLMRGFPPDRLVLSYNGIDTSRFAMNSEKRLAMRQRFDISTEQYVFLLLGWDPIRKGVDIFVKAAEELSRKSRKKSLFVIVGRKETREVLSTLPESSRLGSALRIVEPVDDFSLLVNSVDVLVSASRSEGFSYASLEAMAAARPILCSDIGDTREALGQAAGVWLFPSEDWRMLSELMERMQSLSPLEQEGLGHANAQYVAGHFSLESWTEQMGGVYRSLLREG